MSETQDSVAALFAGGDPVVLATYDCLLAALGDPGPFTEAPKKMSADGPRWPCQALY
ncbi:hypothetical protein EKD04_014960 [Chloroflexales bacterium ZM16-3]|nr:hypothetical protein [Chloroflexales bacterium ZM16-3]